jgi:hypothetical protein
MAEKMRAEASEKLASLGPSADPRVVGIMNVTKNAGYSWTRSTMIDPKDAPKVIVFHEYGHVLHFSKVVGTEIDEFLAKENPRASGWDLVLSKYAGTNDKDYVAEAFALYMECNASDHERIHPELLKIFKKADKK